MAERELFTEHFDAEPDKVWPAVKRALATMDLKEADDHTRTARFSSGLSTFSWGQHLFASVEPDGTGTAVRVSGRPKSTFFSTKWGEGTNVRGFRQELVTTVRERL